ncbi:MAG: Site-specific recombinase, invertase Pin s [Frondihabitans sp.]|nr:Site-specific recombinase, invertase Pin s [Frondihabitans sp.]
MGEDITRRLQRMVESLNLIESAHSRYLAAASADRKQLNNAVLSHILIGPSSEDIHIELRPEIANLRITHAPCTRRDTSPQPNAQQSIHDRRHLRLVRRPDRSM